MITGTTQPTTGSVSITGRVSAMLELGMGFHPDFTGRQNAFMTGQLLGMSVEEITNLMPEIEEFAEIGGYMDQPVRVYSSGMQMRVAFSVATARRPDVLIVDEALSVGDAYFQHKSFGRIREFRELGTTLLLVSHDKQAIQSICTRAILLDAGSIAMQGEPEAVMDYYNALLADHQNQFIRLEVQTSGKIKAISGTGDAVVTNISLISGDSEQVDVVDVGQSVTLRIDVDVKSDLPKLVLGYAIKDRLGQVIFGTNTHLKQQVLTDVIAGSKFRFNIIFPMNLGPGSYSIQTALHSDATHLTNNYEWTDLAMLFNVVNMSKSHFVGSSWIDSTFNIVKL